MQSDSSTDKRCRVPLVQGALSQILRILERAGPDTAYFATLVAKHLTALNAGFLRGFTLLIPSDDSFTHLSHFWGETRASSAFDQKS